MTKNRLKSKTIFSLLFLFVNYSFAQSTKIEVKENKGKIIGTQNIRTYKTYNNNRIYTNVDQTNKNKVLLLNKYIYTTKPILVEIGGNIIDQNMNQLRTGLSPIILSGENVIEVKANKSQLYIYCVIYSINGDYVVKVANNILEPSKKFKQYGTDQWIEVIDKKNVPLLQVNLDKKSNSIKILCVTYTEDACIIASPQGLKFIETFPKPFSLMSDVELKMAELKCSLAIKKYTKPLH